MLKNMKIGSKLFLLLGFFSLLLIAIGMLGLRGIKTANDSLESIFDNQLMSAVLLSKMDALRRENFVELLLALQHDPRLPASKLHEADHPMTKHTDAVMANRAKINNLWEQFLATTLTTEEKKLAEKYRAAREKNRNEAQDPMTALLKDRKFDEANLHSVNKLLPLFTDLGEDLVALIQLQLDVAKAEKDKAEANYARTRNLAVTSIIAGILLALGIGFWIIRSITGRLTESVSAISTSATEIAATVTQHEHTASQQATAANETSATIEELSASSRQSAEQAANAAALAERSSTATAQGGETTRQTVAAMSSLKGKIGAIADQILHLGEQTGQIGSIATLLKDLAGQINMLALNAAVEAARAGEHGKGFAVVAGEVRKLADQSKKSAEQASGLVAEIQKATNSAIMMTEDGTRTVAEVTQLAEKVNALFNSLAGMAGSVNENAQQVMLNARQQAAAFAQIVEAASSIAAGSRETAAGISQTKVGVQKLNEAAGNLKAIA